MFFLQSKVWKNNNIFRNFKSIPTFGLYRTSKIEQIFSNLKKSKKGFIFYESLIYLKYFFKKIFLNSELSPSVAIVNLQINKTIQSYKGLRFFLNLPLRGQWTWTNASTQWILANTPRKRHFTQKNNRWKHESKVTKRK